MIEKIFFTVCISFLFFLKDVDGGGGKHLTNEWNCIYSSDNISHYERWITLDSGRPTRERKCVLVIDCSTEDAYNFLVDPLNIKRWMKGIRKVDLIQPDGEGQQYAYTIFKLPWPFDDKDMVASYEFFCQSASHYIIQIRSVQNVVEKNPRIDRIDEYLAVWELTKLNDNKTEIVFTVHSNTRPVVARFIQDPIMNRIFVQDFFRLKQLLSSSKYVVYSQ